MKFDIKNERQVQAQLNKMKTVLKTGEIGERVFLKQYRNALVSDFSYMAKVSRGKMREVLTTPTGRKRQGKGGKYAGRDRTGEPGGGSMVKSYRLDPKTGKFSEGGKYTFSVGFQNPPKYTIFQEYGTSAGITAMNTLMEDADYIDQDILPQLTQKKRNRIGLWKVIDGDIRQLRVQGLKGNLEGLGD